MDADEQSLPRGSSGLLFQMAKLAVRRARDKAGTTGEDLEAMTAIVLCVVVAEASINEIGEWFEFHHLRPPFSIPHGLPYGFYRLDLRVKWSLLPMIVRQRMFDPGTEPWQSFHVLVELRNAIVHLRRRTLPKAASALLKAKKLDKGHGLSFEVARWACETMADMFEKLTELIDPPKEYIDWLWTPTRWFPRGLSIPGEPFED